MTDRNIIERIHRDLEGELTEAERNQLKEELAGNPEAAAYYSDWQKIQQSFESSREKSPRISLTKEILNRLPMEPNITKKPEPLVRPSFWNMPSFRYSLIFVAGVFLGFLAFTFLMPKGADVRPPAAQVKGSLYDTRSFDQMKRADNLVFENAMVKVNVDVRYSTSVVEARITFSSLYPVQGVLLFDYNALQVMNVMNVSVNDQSTIQASSNFVQINNSGNNQYVVQLLNKNSLPQQLSFKVLQNDVPIYQNAVTINRE